MQDSKNKTVGTPQTTKAQKLEFVTSTGLKPFGRPVVYGVNASSMPKVSKKVNTSSFFLHNHIDKNELVRQPEVAFSPPTPAKRQLYVEAPTGQVRPDPPRRKHHHRDGGPPPRHPKDELRSDRDAQRDVHGMGWNHRHVDDEERSNVASPHLLTHRIP